MSSPCLFALCATLSFGQASPAVDSDDPAALYVQSTSEAIRARRLVTSGVLLSAGAGILTYSALDPGIDRAVRIGALGAGIGFLLFGASGMVFKSAFEEFADIYSTSPIDTRLSLVRKLESDIRTSRRQRFWGGVVLASGSAVLMGLLMYPVVVAGSPMTASTAATIGGTACMIGIGLTNALLPAEEDALTSGLMRVQLTVTPAAVAIGGSF